MRNVNAMHAVLLNFKTYLKKNQIAQSVKNLTKSLMKAAVQTLPR